MAKTSKAPWNKIRSGFDWFSFSISTVFGVGLFPLAPGTAGTFCAIPLVYYSLQWSLTARILFWLGLIFISSSAVAHYSKILERNDDSSIVIDEVIGYGVASWFLKNDLASLAAAFFLFRLFDIWKPFPIRKIDRWSKGTTHFFLRGFGVIADDIAAGIFALVILSVMQALYFLPSAS